MCDGINLNEGIHWQFGYLNTGSGWEIANESFNRQRILNLNMDLSIFVKLSPAYLVCMLH